MKVKDVVKGYDKMEICFNDSQWKKSEKKIKNAFTKSVQVKNQDLITEF